MVSAGKEVTIRRISKAYDVRIRIGRLVATEDRWLRTGRLSVRSGAPSGLGDFGVEIFHNHIFRVQYYSPVAVLSRVFE